jgi:hypothetical protein
VAFYCVDTSTGSEDETRQFVEARNPSTWSQVPAAQYQTNGMSIFINLSSPTGNVFYRLQKQ